MSIPVLLILLSGDVGLPEPQLVVSSIAYEVRRFDRMNNRVPRSWLDLHQPFGCRSFDVHDRAAYPPPGSGQAWRPRDCIYSYRLDRVDNARVRISWRKEGKWLGSVLLAGPRTQ